jgi:hypothetical protein
MAQDSLFTLPDPATGRPVIILNYAIKDKREAKNARRDIAATRRFVLRLRIVNTFLGVSLGCVIMLFILGRDIPNSAWLLAVIAGLVISITIFSEVGRQVHQNAEDASVLQAQILNGTRRHLGYATERDYAMREMLRHGSYEFILMFLVPTLSFMRDPRTIEIDQRLRSRSYEGIYGEFSYTLEMQTGMIIVIAADHFPNHRDVTMTFEVWAQEMLNDHKSLMDMVRAVPHITRT